MAVWKVSRKKSRALIETLAALAAADDGRVPGEEERRPVAGGIGMGDRAADRPPVADLRIADMAREIDEARVVVDDDRVLHDLAVRRASPDAELVVRLHDAVETGDVLDVHQQRRLGEPELDQRDQAVAAGEDLRLSFAVLEDPQRFVQASRTDVVELTGDHRAAVLLSARAEAVGPSSPDRHVAAGDGSTAGRLQARPSCLAIGRDSGVLRVSIGREGGGVNAVAGRERRRGAVRTRTATRHGGAGPAL